MKIKIALLAIGAVLLVGCGPIEFNGSVSSDGMLHLTEKQDPQMPKEVGIIQTYHDKEYEVTCYVVQDASGSPTGVSCIPDQNIQGGCTKQKNDGFPITCPVYQQRGGKITNEKGNSNITGIEDYR